MISKRIKNLPRHYRVVITQKLADELSLKTRSVSVGELVDADKQRKKKVKPIEPAMDDMQKPEDTTNL